MGGESPGEAASSSEVRREAKGEWGKGYGKRKRGERKKKQRDERQEEAYERKGQLSIIHLYLVLFLTKLTFMNRLTSSS